ncbi:PGPGW domain-containing protein [Pendulispora rubella]|uniref:PGPGW domain-containing protein n=1 Tax=Pendulispora rubella TaxID=2741070 RepID=A0ABZ2LD08_9BACT
MRSMPALAVVVGGLSLLMVVAAMWGAKLFIVRIPPDYFLRPAPERTPGARILRTVAGVLIVLAGIAMLVLPGQGVLTIVVGLLVMDLPIQHRVAKWLVARPALHRLIDGWRQRAGQLPLQVEPR